MDLLQISSVPPLTKSILFFLVLLIFQWMGHWYRIRRLRKFPDEKINGLGPIETALIGLTALLLAFSFSLTASKFGMRRDMIVEEAATIRTAILRTNLFPDSIRKAYSDDFRRYVNARIAYYDAGENENQVNATIEDTKNAFADIWKLTVATTHNHENLPLSSLMIPALNNMSESMIRRDASRKALEPGIIILVLVLMLLISGFLAGYGTEGKKRNLILILCFAMMTTLTLYLILELDRPQEGYLNLNDTEQQIIDLQKLF